MQVRQGRRRGDHLVLRAGADGRPHHRGLRHDPPRRVHPVLAAARRGGASVRRLQVHHAAQPFRAADGHPGRAQFRPAEHLLDQQEGIAARLPVQGRDQVRHRSSGEGLRRRRLARARGRPRRRRAARRERLSVHPVPLLRHQRPHRRVWRPAGEPRALPARGDPGDPRARRPEISPAGQALRGRPQQRGAVGEEGQRPLRHGAGRASGASRTAPTRSTSRPARCSRIRSIRRAISRSRRSRRPTTR